MESVREAPRMRPGREPLTGTPVLPPGSRRILLRESGAVVEPALPASAAPNAVRTHRYTPLTWLPKSLYVQFMRLANIYFVLVAVVACTPLWGRKAAAKVLTVTSLLLVQALKDLYEDSKRRKDDHTENSRPTRVFDAQHGCFREVEWQACRVGDIVAVDKGQQLPADVLVAASASSGTVFVSTKSLDGETNLKQRRAPALLQSLSRAAAGAIEAAAELVQGLEVQLEPPHASLLSIECSVALGGGEVSGVSIDNFVLRGCVLENTAWLVGIVCYAGNDTKVRLNSSKVPSKRSEMEQFLNYCVVILVLVILGTSLLFASLEKLLGTNKLTFVKAFATYFVILYVVLPMSLYVMFEGIKIAIGQQIERDPRMLDDETGKPARARNTSVLEELGQVGYLFSDKTGTLTANEMRFAFCFIGNETIGPFLPDASGEPGPGLDNAAQLLRSPEGDHAAAFFEALALCHTVRTDEDGAYQGESPDDVALVQAARSVGVALHCRSTDAIEIESIREGRVRREVACVLPFSSDRKRMSVVCPMSTGGALVITKGADQVMEERLATGLPDGARRALSDFARRGLRTLIVASRRMDAGAYAAWKERWDEASSAMGGQRSIRLEAAAAEAEQQMEFLGVSALEDQLQQGVPETIAALRAAGIRTWVLTGDKVETAVEIARSCALFDDGMPLVYVTGAASSDEADLMLRPHSSGSRRNRGTSIGSFISHTSVSTAPSRGIVLDGISAQHALSSSRTRLRLFQLAERCSSCVCCRLSPMQKRELVELVRQHSGRAVTLAVGDGANDVPMIQGAHVGVGIRGKEGSAAVQASDMAISQFSFLGDLVLYHGRKAYTRLATFLCFFLYKSVVIGCSYLLYAYHVDFSGKLAFPEWLDAMYSPLTSLSVAILLLFDSESGLRGDEAGLSPELYVDGPNRACLNASVYMKWMFYALLHGSLAWEVPFLTLLGDKPDVAFEQGFQFWQVSLTAFTIIIIVIHMKLFLVAEKPIRPIGFSAIILEVLAYFAVALALGSPLCRTLAPMMAGVPASAFTSGVHVLLMLVVPMASLFFDIVALSGASLVSGARR